MADDDLSPRVRPAVLTSAALPLAGVHRVRRQSLPLTKGSRGTWMDAQNNLTQHRLSLPFPRAV
jgi:hypothetical protein